MIGIVEPPRPRSRAIAVDPIRVREPALALPFAGEAPHFDRAIVPGDVANNRSNGSPSGAALMVSTATRGA